MPRILAWIAQEQGNYIACWTSVDTKDRPPVTYCFPSDEHARAWVYYEAELLGVCQITWLDRSP